MKLPPSHNTTSSFLIVTRRLAIVNEDQAVFLESLEILSRQNAYFFAGKIGLFTLKAYFVQKIFLPFFPSALA